ncbi:MAG: hypothetical protein M1837_003973 [Sclerophora amabilis]|nr:MAG: hypothetical protein M1837_003973 [Sclerophora amabilis]
MATTFSSLPIVDLAPLHSQCPTSDELCALSRQLYDVFATTGFAYLINAPLSYSHDDVFGLAKEVFRMEDAEKRKLAKRTFRKENSNTYRGYFPPQAGSDNLKEGFEIGPPTSLPQQGRSLSTKIDLTEPNVWPSETASFRQSSEMLYTELQAISARLLSLVAVSLGKPPMYFSNYLHDSISTLRYLHYPAMPTDRRQLLCCTPHTDSGILTLLHQDATGGLEVLNASGEWVPAPYVPGSIVVNIGDLMAKVSGDRFVATRHRVRSSAIGKSRYSVPFFFEPGLECVVKSVDAPEGQDGGVLYGNHVLEKMSGWVEFQDVDQQPEDDFGVYNTKPVEAY